MRETALIMGMPITVEVIGTLTMAPIAEAFAYFRAVDERFSTYKPESEISAINRGEIATADFSAEMREVFAPLAHQVGGALENFRALLRGDAPPDMKAFLGGGQRLVDIGGRRVRQFREHGFGRRIEHRLGLATFRADPAPGDQKLQVRIIERHGFTP